MAGVDDVARPPSAEESVFDRLRREGRRVKDATAEELVAEARAGVIYVSTEALKITPLGRAWALGAIDPRISPLPRLEHRDRGDGTLRLVWRRPTLATLDAGRQSSPNGEER